MQFRLTGNTRHTFHRHDGHGSSDDQDACSHGFRVGDAGHAGAAMIRALLADRFKLVAHTERREAPLYALRLARPDGRLGPGLTAAAVDARGGFRESDGSLTSERTSMAQLVRELTSYAGRAVVDETGLTGEWSRLMTD
jgi:uncharacterized protein (TIGR03435 family)